MPTTSPRDKNQRPKRNPKTPVKDGSSPMKRAKSKDEENEDKLKKRQEQEEQAERVLTLLCVLSGEHTRGRMPPEAREQLFRIARLEDDTVTKLEYILPAGVQMPDHHNYRHLEHGFLEALITPKPTQDHQRTLRKSETALKNICKLRLSGDIYLDPLTTSGEEIVKIAKESVRDWVNRVYSTTHDALLPDGDLSLVEKEMKFIEKKCGYTSNLQGESKITHAPTRVIIVKDQKELHSDEFRERVLSSSIAIIRNVDNVIDFNKDIYSVKTILKADSETEIYRAVQLPQRTNSNVHPDDGRTVWGVTSKKSKIKFKEFAEYHDKLMEVSREGYKVMSDSDATITNFEMLKQKVMAVNSDTAHCRIWFGTNFDLNDPVKHKKQIAELQKFPGFLRPLGPGDLLHHLPGPIGGISQPQAYYKVPSSRTFGHLENSAVASFNMNLGPAPCTWYAVSFEFAQRMSKLLSTRQMTHYSGFWIPEEKIRDPGNKWGAIPLQKFVQEPGDIVYVGPGTYHWVTCPGFTVNVSWNIAPATSVQLSSMIILQDHALDSWAKNNIEIPMVPLILNLVKAKKFVKDQKMFEILKNLMARYLAFAQIELLVLESETQLTKVKNSSRGKEDVNIPGRNMIPTVITSEQKWVQTVERCPSCKHVLNNTIIRNDATEASYCLFCYQVLDSICHVYIRHTIPQLVKIYDDYRA